MTTLFNNPQLSSALRSRRRTTWPCGVRGTRRTGSATAAAVASRAHRATACGARTPPRARRRRRGARRCRVVNVSTLFPVLSYQPSRSLWVYSSSNVACLCCKPFFVVFFCVSTGITCAVPEDASKHTLTRCSDPLDRLQPGATCSFACDVGFELQLEPQPVVQCTEDGTWNASAPTCKGKQINNKKCIH